MSKVLDEAMSYARGDGAEKTPHYLPTSVRKLTRRGIMWLGLTCNLRCQFCYFLDRIENPAHPEHAFMSLDKAKAICLTLVDYYGNNSIDIQGGEPTLYPHIFELVEYCTGVGLSPTLITNAVLLSSHEEVIRFKEAGIRDFLISVQGLGGTYDRIVRREGSHILQMKALGNLQQVGIPFRFNTVLSKAALPQLLDISKLAVGTGAGVVNFLGFNPFNDQQTGKRSTENVPTYDEIRRPLQEALDYLIDQNVEGNVRYLPLCLASERHRPNAYGFKQLPYDLHENDYASWSWTDLPAQRSASSELSPPFGLGRRLRLGALRTPLRRLDRRWPKLGIPLHQIKQAIERAWAKERGLCKGAAVLEQRYRAEAVFRAREYTGYQYVAGCETCSVRTICDGVYADYANLFGVKGIRPIRLEDSVTDPQHYTRQQYKVIHPLDRGWLEQIDSSDLQSPTEREVPGTGK